MENPLNKLAWVASLALGFPVWNAIFSLSFGYMGWGSVLYICIGILAGILFKLALFPEDVFDNLSVRTWSKKVIKEEFEPEIDDISPIVIKEKSRAKERPEPVIYEKPKPRKPNALVSWFAENTLAKVGGLLIFLAIIAFLSVIYTQIGPVGRLVISIWVSLSIYGVGVYLFSKKSFVHESQIVLGVSVAALYLSLLYIFRVPVFLESFGANLPYIVLGLLTIAVIWWSMTGMIFGSTSLFTFSIAIAYINPFLIGANLSTIQFLIYIILISGGAIATALYLVLQKKEDSLASIVLHIAFWWSLVLIGWVSTNTTYEFNSVLVVIVALTGATSWGASFLKGTKSLSIFLIAGGVSLFLTMLWTEIYNTLSWSIVLGVSMICIFGMLGKYKMKLGVGTLITIFSLPLVLWVAWYITGFWFTPVIAFGGMILLYAVLLMIFTVIPSWFSSILFVLFGVAGVFFTPWLFVDISLTSRYLLMAIGVFLFAFGHYFTLKRNISVTPIIHTLTSLGLLALNRPGAAPFWAILAVSLLTLATIGISFYAYNKKLQSSLDHILVPIIGAASLVGTLLYFWTIQAHWWIALGWILLVVAAVYIWAFMVFLKPLQQKVEQYMTVTYLAIATSIITLAIAYLFSDYESAKTLAWIIEASLIFTVYARFTNPWVLTGAILVQIVGISQFAIMGPELPEDMVVFAVVFLTSFWNIWSLRNIATDKTWAAEIVLFISTCIWYTALLFEANWSSKDFIIVSEILIMLHTILLAHAFKKVYFSGLMVVSIMFLTVFIETMDGDKWLYFVAPFCLFVSQYYFAKKQPGIFAKMQWLIVGIGTFIVSSFWVDGHFANQYMLTIWWSLWIGGLLTIGINRQISILRSLGLMVYLLTLTKILFVDLGRIFSSNEGSGVYVGIGIIMLLGIVSIGLSMLYKKLMGDGALKRDFLFQGGATEKENIKDILLRLNISNIKSVSFSSPNERPVQSGESENLRRIALYIVKTTKKNTFEPGELDEFYTLIAPVIESKYGSDALTKGKAMMKNFAKKGGTIEIKS